MTNDRNNWNTKVIEEFRANGGGQFVWMPLLFCTTPR